MRGKETTPKAAQKNTAYREKVGENRIKYTLGSW